MLFCKYNDPPYIKAAKIDILVSVATEENLEPVLLEFCDYAREVDMDLAFLAVKAIGNLAIRLSHLQPIKALHSLVLLKRVHLTNKIAVVIKDVSMSINTKEFVWKPLIIDIINYLDVFDQVDSKEAVLWLSWAKDQLLSAIVKCFLKNPNSRSNSLVV